MTDALALVTHIRGDDPILQLDAMTKIRKLLSLDDPPVQQVLALNILNRVVHFLASESPELQLEAAWTLTNIASGSSSETRAVVDADAVRHLVALLRSPHNQVREQAVWALGNIAGDSPHCRDHVLLHGVMPLLLDCFSDMSRESLVRNATHALSNLCRGKPQPPFDIVQPALGVLALLIRGDDADVLSDACWALGYLADGPNDRIQAVLDAGVLPRVVQLLDHQAFTVQTPALRCVGNIVTGDDQQTQKVIDSNALAYLAKLLESTRRSIRKEACWAISNITGGNEAQIQAVIDSGVVPTLVSMLGTAPLEIKKEVCWALSNAIVGGTPAQIDHLVQCEVVRPLVDMLAVPNVKVTALEGLDKILRVCASAVAQALSAGVLAALDDSLFANTAIALRVIEQCASVDAGSVLESGLLSKVASLPHADLTLEMKQSIARTVFLCYNSATPKQLDDLVDTGIFSQMYVIRDRAATICIAMQDLELPALVTLELLDAAFPNDIPMHKKWQLATAIKHFHRV
jgi:importin subunit alpha-1